MKKKLYLLIALCLVGVLLISTVVLSFATKSYAVDASYSPMSVTVYYNGNDESFNNSTETFTKLIEKVQKSFKTNYLKALFQGKSAVVPTVISRTSSSIPGISADGTYNSSSYTYVEFFYNSTQKIRENGKDFNDNGTKDYISMFIQVSNENNMHDVNVYYKNGASFVYYYTLTMANQKDLFDYIKTLNI